MPHKHEQCACMHPFMWATMQWLADTPSARAAAAAHQPACHLQHLSPEALASCKQREQVRSPEEHIAAWIRWMNRTHGVHNKTSTMCSSLPVLLARCIGSERRDQLVVEQHMPEGCGLQPGWWGRWGKRLRIEDRCPYIGGWFGCHKQLPQRLGQLLKRSLER